MRVGSSPSRFSGNTPAAYGNSPGTFSVSCHRRMSAAAVYQAKSRILSRLSELVAAQIEEEG